MNTSTKADVGANTNNMEQSRATTMDREDSWDEARAMLEMEQALEVFASTGVDESNILDHSDMVQATITDRFSCGKFDEAELLQMAYQVLLGAHKSARKPLRNLDLSTSSSSSDPDSHGMNTSTKADVGANTNNMEQSRATTMDREDSWDEARAMLEMEQALEVFASTGVDESNILDHSDMVQATITDRFSCGRNYEARLLQKAYQVLLQKANNSASSGQSGARTMDREAAAAVFHTAGLHVDVDIVSKYHEEVGYAIASNERSRNFIIADLLRKAYKFFSVENCLR